ncbi:MAG: PHP domain-containing protein [Archaeoglobaceae archaeon]|nr:PHP domain-containing protein [Archaeoglobaceae archaeon]MDW7989377.1 PHP domain-containing protein [Archaeoglobaceae archaeon]
MFDFHIHSNYSDGNASVQEIAKKAKERGIKRIAIVDHSIELSFGLDEKKARMREKEIELAREIYGLKIYSGIECGINNFGEIFLPDFDFELIVISVHEDAHNYFERIIECIENNEVHVVGHLLSTMFEFIRNCELEDIFLDKLEELGIALELNSNHRCPPDYFLEKCKERKLKISIGSDAHRLEKVGRIEWSIEKAKKYLWCAKFLEL